MDLEIQQKVKDAAESIGADNLVVILGGAEAESSGLSAETVTTGDPTYAGPLAGVELGLTVYHVVEDAVKAEFNEEIYEDQCGMMEMVLDVDGIKEEMNRVRG